MSCKHALDQLDAYTDGSLTGWARWRVGLHLWICRNCRRYLASYRTTVRLAKEAFDHATGTDAAAAPDTLVAAILSAARPK